jgi:hypothetical protein
MYKHWWAPLLKKVTITSLQLLGPEKSYDYFAVCNWAMKESNDYFTTCYWALNKRTISSLLVTFCNKKCKD